MILKGIPIRQLPVCQAIARPQFTGRGNAALTIKKFEKEDIEKVLAFERALRAECKAQGGIDRADGQ